MNLSLGLLEQGWIYLQDYWSKVEYNSRITGARIDLCPGLLEQGWIYLQDYWSKVGCIPRITGARLDVFLGLREQGWIYLQDYWRSEEYPCLLKKWGISRFNVEVRDIQVYYRKWGISRFTVEVRDIQVYCRSEGSVTSRFISRLQQGQFMCPQSH